MMLSDTEETLTATDKAATIGSSTDHNTASIPTAERTNDPQLGEGMDEHSAAFNTVMDATEDDAYNGACWKVVRNKRRARNAAALEAASLLKTDSDNPLTKPRPSGTTRLLPLPFRDEKVVLRPLGGLRLDKWPKPTLATALWAAAGVSPNALLQVQELSLGQRTYPVSSYLAAPDDSCKGIVPGLEPGTTSDTLVEEMQVTGIQILQARMMGAELRCYPHRPRHPVCKTCLKLGHRADHCPTPDLIICEQCGIDNPMPSHPCSPRCKSCGGDHATTDPKCPRRQRQSLNRSWVKKAIDGERRQMTASTHAAPSSATTHAPETSKKSGRSRSKTRSRARSKTRTKSKSRSRSRSQSTSARIQEKTPYYPGITSIPIAVQEGTTKQTGNFNSYPGASAATGLGQQQCHGGTSGEYKNQRKKDDTWDLIGKKLGLSGAECRKQWQYLRDKFLMEIRTIEKAKSGSAAKQKKLWSHFQMLSFLRGLPQSGQMPHGGNNSVPRSGIPSLLTNHGPQPARGSILCHPTPRKPY
ncbi:hypothetical protein HPB52_019382 [Rhipicephalus sanguineus]|uniref:MADF domain-containing protein n=1 Tax=Rhipicephalus sanguineus TaxID=34632 RepID=A0A9D4Q7W6_RHISA|nr:hypothetical protein HPB52_019382 [Rhipicephalus sanguineus]